MDSNSCEARERRFSVSRDDVWAGREESVSLVEASPFQESERGGMIVIIDFCLIEYCRCIE